MKLGDQPKSLGVALKVKKITQLLLGQDICDRFTAHLQARQVLYEPLSYGFLSEMPERRIAYIMYKSGALDDLSDGFFGLKCEVGVKSLIYDSLGNILSE